jgi:hypothetical protein
MIKLKSVDGIDVEQMTEEILIAQVKYLVSNLKYLRGFKTRMEKEFHGLWHVETVQEFQNFFQKYKSASKSEPINPQVSALFDANMKLQESQRTMKKELNEMKASLDTANQMRLKREEELVILRKQSEQLEQSALQKQLYLEQRIVELEKQCETWKQEFTRASTSLMSHSMIEEQNDSMGLRNSSPLIAHANASANEAKNENMVESESEVRLILFGHSFHRMNSVQPILT